MTWRVLINGREVGLVREVSNQSAAYVAACRKFREKLTYACVVEVEPKNGNSASDAR